MVAISKSSLLSRTLRKSLSGSKNGIRKIDLTDGIESIPQERGIIKFLFNAAKKLIGFFGAAIGFIAWSAQSIFEWGVDRYFEIKEFDWNASDQELKKIQQTYTQQLFQIWGQFLGQGFGRIAAVGIGWGVSFAIPVIGGPALAKMVLSSSSTELVEELLFELQFAIRQSAALAARSGLIEAYIGIRSQLKRINPKWAKWGAEGGPKWSFAESGDKLTESIKNPNLKASLTGFFDGVEDGFIEQGFLVAQSIDEAIAVQRSAKQNILGAQREITVWPDKESTEKFTITGPEQFVINSVQEQLIEHKRLESKDIGQIISTQIEMPIALAPQLRKLVIQFYDRPAPPWRIAKKRPSEANISIPDVRPGLSFTAIKSVLPRSFTRGPIRVSCKMSNGRSMHAFAASEKEGETVIRALARLSTESINEQSWDVNSYPGRLKSDLPDRAVVFPAFAHLLYPRRKRGRTSGPLGENQRMAIWGNEAKDLDRFAD